MGRLRSAILVATAVGAVLAVSAGLAGCGGGGGVPPLSIVLAASTNTVAARTASVHVSTIITPNAAAPANPVLNGQPLVGDGKEDFGAHVATVTVQVPRAGSIEVVYSGHVIYERIPQLAAQTGKAWVKIDLDNLGKRAGVSGLSSLAQGSGGDPSEGLSYLRGAVGAVVTAGHEKVRGVQTTHYKATTDVNRAAAQLPVAQQATTKQISDQFGITTIPVEVWIDAQGRARRVQITIVYSGAHLPAGFPANALPQRVESTAEFYDFGTPVSVTVPPADQAADLAQLAGQGGSRPS
ncbi:MAG TPA: hypothetical protein VF954_08060 [Acidimicrobiales bacterium]